MVATLTTVSALTKEIYQGQIQDQLQSEVIGLARIEKTSRGVESTVGGKYVTFPIRVRRNQGIGYRQENEQLQAGGQQGYASVRVGLKYGYGRVRLTGQTMDLAETNEQAFANAMDEEMQGLKDDVRKDTARQFYGTGQGILTYTNAAGAASATFMATLSGASAVPWTQYLEVGQVVDIVTLGTGAIKASGRVINAINTATGAVTLDAVATWAVGDVLVRTGNGPVSSTVNREVTGLGSIVTNTGSLFNVDPATEPIWAATVDANGGVNRALSETLMISNVDAARTKGGKTSVIFTGLGARRSYFNLLTQQRRFTGVQEFQGGFKGLAFAAGNDDIPVVVDVDAPPNNMYGLDESSLTVYREKPWYFMNADGSIWKWVHDFDAFEAVLKQYWEIGTNRRNANWVIKDITES